MLFLCESANDLIPASDDMGIDNADRWRPVSLCKQYRLGPAT